MRSAPLARRVLPRALRHHTKRLLRRWWMPRRAESFERLRRVTRIRARRLAFGRFDRSARGSVSRWPKGPSSSLSNCIGTVGHMVRPLSQVVPWFRAIYVERRNRCATHRPAGSCLSTCLRAYLISLDFPRGLVARASVRPQRLYETARSGELPIFCNMVRASAHNSATSL